MLAAVQDAARRYAVAFGHPGPPLRASARRSAGRDDGMAVLIEQQDDCLSPTVAGDGLGLQFAPVRSTLRRGRRCRYRRRGRRIVRGSRPQRAESDAKEFERFLLVIGSQPGLPQDWGCKCQEACCASVL